MYKIIHRANERGHANHGWLDTWHTFSFADYYNPASMHFGVLRVLNDDSVAPGMGFGTHPHRDMEIISIPLEGDLEHRDSIGSHGVIRKGDVQVMSAGTGVEHSEFNHNKDKQVKVLQIWVFPRAKNLPPRYGQSYFDASERANKWQLIVSPNSEESETWINQDAWFQLACLDKGNQLDYTLKKTGNGVYLFVIEGAVEVGDDLLNKRDGIGITGEEKLIIKSSSDAELLLMELPMHLP